MLNDRRLSAILACRNEGQRLYGKPLQNLSISSQCSSLDYIIKTLRQVECIDSIILAISEKSANHDYVDFAHRNKLPYVLGDDDDVLGRLIKAADTFKCSDVFRITSESPFVHLEEIDSVWEQHINECNHATFFDRTIDGCGFEIISADTLNQSHRKGSSRHRSEMCTLYIRENKSDFKLKVVQADQQYERYDLRLTIDYPEDLIVCRAVFNEFDLLNNTHKVSEIIQFLDRRPDLKKLIEPYTQSGYEIMYL